MSDGRSLVYLFTGGCGFLGRHMLGVTLEKEDLVCEIRLFDKVVDPRLTEHSTGNTVLTDTGRWWISTALLSWIPSITNPFSTSIPACVELDS